MGVIAHEVLHVVLGHVDRRDWRDHRTWNMAADFAVNLMLNDHGFKLPAGGLFNKSYRGQTTEQIYDTLIRATSAARASFSSNAGGRLKRRRTEATASPGIEHEDLLSPEDLRTADLRDADAPDAEQRRLIRRQLIAEMKTHLHGTTRGFFSNEIEVAVEVAIDWRSVLRRFLFDRVRTDWQSYPFNKRWIHRGLLMPSLGVESPSRLVVAIDTSGSMTTEMLSQALGEVNSLRDVFPCDLTILQCDAAIQQAEHYHAQEQVPTPTRRTVKGRGGTDFTPVFDWLHANREPTSTAVIYFTDGYGTFPKTGSEWPVIWMVERDGLKTSAFPFGVVCRLS